MATPLELAPSLMLDESLKIESLLSPQPTKPYYQLNLRKESKLCGQEKKSFYDILAMAAGSSDSYTLQAFVDTFKDQYNKLDTSGFAFAPMQPGFSFEATGKKSTVSMLWQHTLT